MQSNDTLSWQDQLEANLAAIHGLGLREIFAAGPRRLFLERSVENHGTYRLYVARPFGARSHKGRRWRIQISVQPHDGEQQYTVNDGALVARDEDLPAILREAAAKLDEHIQANVKAVRSVRALAVAAVNLPDTAAGSEPAGDAKEG